MYIAADVRAHQLVLPPCDVVIKAVADYVRNIQDTSDLDAIAKDVFQHSQSRTDDKVKRFKRAVAYYSATNKPMAFHPTHYLARPNQFGMPGIVPPYVSSQMLNIPQTPLQAKHVSQHMSSQGSAQGPGPYPYNLSESAITLDAGGKNLSEQNNYSNIPHEGKHTPLYERSSPINPAQSGSPNHVDSTYFPASSASSSSDNDDGNGSAVNHVGGNKLSWEKSGTQSENQARGDPEDQTKGYERLSLTGLSFSGGSWGTTVLATGRNVSFCVQEGFGFRSRHVRTGLVERYAKRAEASGHLRRPEQASRSTPIHSIKRGFANQHRALIRRSVAEGSGAFWQN
uniref:Uncharacterized protein n=1 Tax=Sphaerodactylus townsendi TaxID=933632 RepID=A0ACB8EIN2_9SAUR